MSGQITTIEQLVQLYREAYAGTRNQVGPVLIGGEQIMKLSEETVALMEEIRIDLIKKYKQTPARMYLEEDLKMLEKPFFQRPIEEQQEIEKPIQLSTLGQDTSIDEQLRSTIELDDGPSLSSPWPMGTESWHIHEIKPQRILDLPEKMSNIQTIISSNEIVSQTDEVHSLQALKIIELDVHQPTPAGKNSQNAETSSQLLRAVPLVNEQQQSHFEPPQITNVRYKPKLRLCRRHTNQKHRLHDLVSTSKQWFTKSLPNVKTIKILRDLESLLLYAIL
ncbi:unnamed protein product [Adineta steineri]|uniref:Uncharacterized protein n=1 Tax=Adineta steineri TaxID=433720 RepID=A0A820DGQ8_9BILA|nr:unnamed protein product [Adineta steineri]